MAKQRDQGWNDLVTRSVDLGAGVLRLYGEAVRDVVTGKVSYNNLADRASTVARDEGGAYVRSLAQAYIDYWGKVLAISSDFRQRLADEATPAVEESPCRGGGAELEFVGQAGEDIGRAFVVENNQDQAVDVSFEVSEFVGDGSSSRLRPALAIEPATFRLEPGREQVVSCRLTLEPAFPANRPHQALLRVMGFPGMQVALRAVRLA
jgi:hypothetical protein